MLAIYQPQRSALTVNAPSPPDEPVTEAFVRDHTNLTVSDDIELLSSYITAARQMVEAETNRVLMTTGCTLKIDRFPVDQDAVIELFGGICQSVESITYVDTDGVTQTWDAANYVADLTSSRGNARIGLAYEKTWPAVQPRGLAVTISYTAGWSSAGDVPAPLRVAIAKLAATLYDERHADGADVKESRWFRAMVRQWRIWKVA